VTRYPVPTTSPTRPFRARFAARWWQNCILRQLGLVAALLISAGFAEAFAAEGQSVAVPFTALSTYYISPTGNDQSAGTSRKTAWATPHHNVNCGDVILVEPGNYILGKYITAFGANNWGTVANCPSGSGGIDGTGGIYFAIVLCAGPHLGACTVSGAPSINNPTVNNEAFRVDQSNWAVEGFVSTQSPSASTGCMTATSESNTVIAFIAFVNNIVSTCGVDGFGTYGWTARGGVDQSAVVGAIAYNASPSRGGNCGSGVSMIPTSGTTPTSGAHIFVAGEFGYKNIADPHGSGCHTDGEGLVFDSWGCPTTGYHYQGVAEQNVWWQNGSAGFEVFPNTTCNSKSNSDLAQVYVFNNTSCDNQEDPLRAGQSPDLFLNQISPVPGETVYSVTNNIFKPAKASAGNNGASPVYGAGVYINNTNTSTISITGNYIWQSNPGTSRRVGNPNTDVHINGRQNNITFPFGLNVYNDPGFANPNDLPTTAPNCSEYTNTTACMNEGYKVAANLKPSVAVGKGYQPPGPCRPDPYFPVWLKGIVFLHWNGSTLTEDTGLITKPCDM
jgi:hypothetical protein